MNDSCVDNVTHKLLVDASISVSALATVACLAAIVLIVFIGIYRVFLIRLVLYFILLLLVNAVTHILLNTLPFLERAITEYVIITVQWMQVFATVWITTYLFLLIMFKVQLNKAYQEVAGLLLVVLTPLTFTWSIYPLICARANKCVPCLVIRFLLTLGCFSAVSLMAGVLCKRWRANHYRYELQRQHWSVLREALPFIVYPAISCVALAIDCTIHIHYIVRGYSKSSYAIKVYHSLPLEELVLPLVLILNPNTYHLLRRVRRMKGRDQKEDKTDEKRELLFSQEITSK